MDANPYLAPEETSLGTENAEENHTGWLYCLCVFVGIQVILLLGLIGLGGVARIPQLMVGSTVSLVISIAIIVGLLKRQEWARIWLIWMTYTSIIFMVPQVSQMPMVIIPAICFDVCILILCHCPPVRRVTKAHSTAEAYIYRESPSDAESQTS